MNWSSKSMKELKKYCKEAKIDAEQVLNHGPLTKKASWAKACEEHYHRNGFSQKSQVMPGVKIRANLTRHRGYRLIVYDGAGDEMIKYNRRTKEINEVAKVLRSIENQGADLKVEVRGASLLDELNEALAADLTIAEIPKDTRRHRVPVIGVVATTHPNLQSFAALAQAAGLTQTLIEPGLNAIAFIPSDEAIEQLPEDAVEYLLSNRGALTEVLKNHLVAITPAVGKGFLASVSGDELATLAGETIVVNADDIVEADIVANNGIIHIVDTVFLPDSIGFDFTPAKSIRKNPMCYCMQKGCGTCYTETPSWIEADSRRNPSVAGGNVINEQLGPNHTLSTGDTFRTESAVLEMNLPGLRNTRFLRMQKINSFRDPTNSGWKVAYGDMGTGYNTYYILDSNSRNDSRNARQQWMIEWMTKADKEFLTEIGLYPTDKYASRSKNSNLTYTFTAKVSKAPPGYRRAARRAAGDFEPMWLDAWNWMIEQPETRRNPMPEGYTFDQWAETEAGKHGDNITFKKWAKEEAEEFGDEYIDAEYPDAPKDVKNLLSSRHTKGFRNWTESEMEEDTHSRHNPTEKTFLVYPKYYHEGEPEMLKWIANSPTEIMVSIDLEGETEPSMIKEMLFEHLEEKRDLPIITSLTYTESRQNPMQVYAPGKQDIENSKTAIRSKYPNVQFADDMIYLVNQTGSSNKYHAFFMTNLGGFNAYARIGYNPKVVGPMSKQEWNNKIGKKMNGGYERMKVNSAVIVPEAEGYTGKAMAMQYAYDRANHEEAFLEATSPYSISKNPKSDFIKKGAMHAKDYIVEHEDGLRQAAARGMRKGANMIEPRRNGKMSNLAHDYIEAVANSEEEFEHMMSQLSTGALNLPPIHDMQKVVEKHMKSVDHSMHNMEHHVRDYIPAGMRRNGKGCGCSGKNPCACRSNPRPQEVAYAKWLETHPTDLHFDGYAEKMDKQCHFCSGDYAESYIYEGTHDWGEGEEEFQACGYCIEDDSNFEPESRRNPHGNVHCHSCYTDVFELDYCQACGVCDDCCGCRSNPSVNVSKGTQITSPMHDTSLYATNSYPEPDIDDDTMTQTQFVSEAYRGIMQREPDKGGHSGYRRTLKGDEGKEHNRGARESLLRSLHRTSEAKKIGKARKSQATQAEVDKVSADFMAKRGVKIAKSMPTPSFPGPSSPVDPPILGLSNLWGDEGWFFDYGRSSGNKRRWWNDLDWMTFDEMTSRYGELDMWEGPLSDEWKPGSKLPLFANLKQASSPNSKPSIICISPKFSTWNNDGGVTVWPTRNDKSAREWKHHMMGEMYRNTSGDLSKPQPKGWMGALTYYKNGHYEGYVGSKGSGVQNPAKLMVDDINARYGVRIPVGKMKSPAKNPRKNAKHEVMQCDRCTRHTLRGGLLPYQIKNYPEMDADYCYDCIREMEKEEKDRIEKEKADAIKAAEEERLLAEAVEANKVEVAFDGTRKNPRMPLDGMENRFSRKKLGNSNGLHAFCQKAKMGARYRRKLASEHNCPIGIVEEIDKYYSQYATDEDKAVALELYQEWC